jgi:hypothetical protein
MCLKQLLFISWKLFSKLISFYRFQNCFGTGQFLPVFTGIENFLDRSDRIGPKILDQLQFCVLQPETVRSSWKQSVLCKMKASTRTINYIIFKSNLSSIEMSFKKNFPYVDLWTYWDHNVYKYYTVHQLVYGL